MIDSIEPLLCEVIVISYDGQVDDKTDQYNGMGVAIMDNQCSYEGYFKGGFFHGKGKFTWADGVSFEGEFVSGMMQGKGTYKWTDGSAYDGMIVEGKRQGKGIFKCSAGQIYDGDWFEGKRHGEGKMTYNEEKTIVYIGEWRLGMREGYGTMRYISGNTYEGCWADDKKCGRGVMIWKDIDEVYSGDWYDDKPHGRGEHIWGDNGSKSLTKQVCNIYRGEWACGLREGMGTFFYANGSQYTGQWLANQKNGEGVFVHPDGKIFVGDFERDRILSHEGCTARATEDVNVQTRLNIGDILLRFPEARVEPTLSPLTKNKPPSSIPTVPPAFSSSVLTDADEADPFLTQTKEIERLLLRYNSITRSYYRQTAELANRKRMREINLISISDPDTNNWPKVEQAMFQARNFSKRLFGMTLDQMRRFLREIGIIGASFNSYDLTLCIRRMRDHHRVVAEQLLYTHRCRKPPSPYGEAPPRLFATDSSAATILPIMEKSFFGGAYCSDLQPLPPSLSVKATAVDLVYSYDSDPRQPLLEREFCELLVRAVGEAACRSGSVRGRSLYYMAFEVFAKKVQPFFADWSLVPPETAALYNDHVQETLRSLSTTSLKDVWTTIVCAARAQGVRESSLEPVAQIRHAIGYFLTLRGTAIPTGTTTTELLTIIGAPTIQPVEEGNEQHHQQEHAAADDAAIDFSWLSKLMDFDDFFVMLCKIILSKLWMFQKMSSAGEVAGGTEVGEGDDQSQAPSQAAGESISEAGTDAEEDMDLKELLGYRLGRWAETLSTAVAQV